MSTGAHQNRSISLRLLLGLSILTNSFLTASSTQGDCAAMQRLPLLFLGHGGGPLPLMGHDGHADLIKTWDAGSDIYNILHSEAVQSVVIVSAHHESADGRILIMDDEQPSLLYDYGGFPPETYKYTMPNPGSRVLAARVASLLAAAGIANSMETNRGHDHGVFVPLLGLKVPQKRPDLPVISISLPGPADYSQQGQTENHWNFGKALTALRMEGVLFVGSGNSFHSRANIPAESKAYDTYLQGLAQGAGGKDFRHWADHPAARKCHPRPEHLLPLIVLAGAAAASTPKGQVQAIPHDFMGHAASHFVFH